MPDCLLVVSLVPCASVFAVRRVGITMTIIVGFCVELNSVNSVGEGVG